MSLDQFWDATPFELGIVLAGYNKRIWTYYEVAAFTAAHIMNVWTKKRITARKLMPSKPGTVNASQFNSPEELDAFVQSRRGKVPG